MNFIVHGVVWDMVIKTVRLIFSLFDGIIHAFIKWAFVGVIDIANFRVQPGMIDDLKRRIYIFIGIFMAFKMMYAFLMYMIHPENFLSETKGAGKFLGRIVVSVSLLVFLPFLFDTMYKAQSILIPMVPKILMVNQADGDTVSAESVEKQAELMSVSILRAFFYPTEGSSAPDINSMNDFKDNVTNIKKYEYHFFLSFLMGLYCLYVVVFRITIEVAMRVFKLFILELVAPIPVIALMDPNTSEVNTPFDNWLNEVSTTFLSLFIHLGGFYLLLSVLNLLLNNSLGILQGNPELSFFRRNYIRIMLILGMFKVLPALPGLIVRALGIEDESIVKNFAENLGKFTGGVMGGVSGVVSGAIKGGATGGLHGAAAGAIAGGLTGAKSGAEEGAQMATKNPNNMKLKELYNKGNLSVQQKLQGREDPLSFGDKLYDNMGKWAANPANEATKRARLYNFVNDSVVNPERQLKNIGGAAAPIKKEDLAQQKAEIEKLNRDIAYQRLATQRYQSERSRIINEYGTSEEIQQQLDQLNDSASKFNDYQQELLNALLNSNNQEEQQLGQEMNNLLSKRDQDLSNIKLQYDGEIDQLTNEYIAAKNNNDLELAGAKYDEIVQKNKEKNSAISTYKMQFNKDFGEIYDRVSQSRKAHHLQNNGLDEEKYQSYKEVVDEIGRISKGQSEAKENIYNISKYDEAINLSVQNTMDLEKDKEKLNKIASNMSEIIKSFENVERKPDPELTPASHNLKDYMSDNPNKDRIDDIGNKIGGINE